MSDKMISENTENENLVEQGMDLLTEAQSTTDDNYFYSMPIAALATLGSEAASLIPQLRTTTTTKTIDMKGLFRVANADAGDVLKMAKNGNFWGAIKTSEGKSKMAKFAQVDSVESVTKTVTEIPVNPATLMMAVALFSIEEQLNTIEDMQKQILRNMEFDKQSKVEGDVEQLFSIISKYKYNWDNDRFISSNHKMVNDIQRTARANIISFQKEINSIINNKDFALVQLQVKAKLDYLLKQFRFYRLSLYTFSMASLLEILLSGNFKEEYVNGIKSEIERLSSDYREIFDKCSCFIEKMSDATVDTNVLKGIGNVGKITGKIIGAIPVIEKGPVDEFLKEKGDQLKENASELQMDSVKKLAQLNNPGTIIFTSKMKDLVEIYNHTSKISVNHEYICLG